jgi:hypothetical protein
MLLSAGWNRLDFLFDQSFVALKLQAANKSLSLSFADQ